MTSSNATAFVLLLARLLQPSVCVPWVKPTVDRDVLQQAFSVFGDVRRMDVVDKGDHMLCFVHFDKWHLHNPSAAATRQRLLRPQSQVGLLHALH